VTAGANAPPAPPQHSAAATEDQSVVVGANAQPASLQQEDQRSTVSNEGPSVGPGANPPQLSPQQEDQRPATNNGEPNVALGENPLQPPPQEEDHHSYVDGDELPDEPPRANLLQAQEKNPNSNDGNDDREHLQASPQEKDQYATGGHEEPGDDDDNHEHNPHWNAYTDEMNEAYDQRQAYRKSVIQAGGQDPDDDPDDPYNISARWAPSPERDQEKRYSVNKEDIQLFL